MRVRLGWRVSAHIQKTNKKLKKKPKNRKRILKIQKRRKEGPAAYKGQELLARGTKQMKVAGEFSKKKE